MSLVKANIDIAAPPEAVWDVVMNVRCYGDWVTIHRKLGKVDSGEPRPGFTVEQTLAIAGAPFKVTWTLGRFEAGRLAEWDGKGPARSNARTLYRLEPTESDGAPGTRFEYENEFTAPGGPLGRLAGRVLVGGISEREAQASLKKLKQLLERR